MEIKSSYASLHKAKNLRNFPQKVKNIRKLYAELRKVNLLYAHFMQFYPALCTLRKAKTLYATLRTWQLADDGGPDQQLVRPLLLPTRQHLAY